MVVIVSHNANLGNVIPILFQHRWASAAWLQSTRHPITSWHWREGLKAESRFVGTRDYSSLLTAPAAVDYLREWRATPRTVGADSSDEPIVWPTLKVSEEAEEDDEGYERAEAFCTRSALAAREVLGEAWGTGPAQPAETVCVSPPPSPSPFSSLSLGTSPPLRFFSLSSSSSFSTSSLGGPNGDGAAPTCAYVR